jgi:hypothetical protein
MIGAHSSLVIGKHLRFVIGGARMYARMRLWLLELEVVLKLAMPLF